MLIPYEVGVARKVSNFAFEHVFVASSSTNLLLIVDDNSFNICALESLFSQFNFECDSCVDGREAIKLVQARCESNDPMYKLILMDYSMPNCDGTKATSEIRKLVEETQKARQDIEQPVICCQTAYSEQ